MEKNNYKFRRIKFIGEKVRMRVLFLTNIPSPYRVTFFNELGKMCDLTVLYERKTASDRDSKWRSEEAKNFKQVFLKGKNIRADAAICLDVIKWLNKDKFDVFVVGGYSTATGMLAIQILKLKQIPFILNSDGGFVKNEHYLKYILKRYLISSAGYWLSTGNQTNEYLIYYGANSEKIFTYPFTSIQQDDIESIGYEEKIEIRKKLKIKSEKVILSVGQFIHRKGYDLLLGDWDKIEKNTALVIIGSGQNKNKIEEIINRKNLKNVYIVPFKTKKELDKYYLMADMFVLPTREDIWGLVINEAMAKGLPVITTNKCIAGMELIEENKNGIIINLDDFGKLTEIINKLSIEEMKKMGEYSKEKIKKYTIERMAIEHINIFNKINKNRR